MKKFFFALLLAAALSLPLFAKGAAESKFSVANFSTGKLSDYDRPLIDAIAYFADSFWSFNRIALSLAVGLGFVGVTWCAIKMMFGSENSRKTALDLMAKFLIYTLVMAAYPKVIDGILDLSTNIGMFAGGGYSRVNSKFYSFRQQFEKDTDVAKNEMQRMLLSIADPKNTKNKNIVLTEDLARKMISRYAVSADEEDRIFTELSKTYSFMPSDDYEKYIRSRGAKGVYGNYNSNVLNDIAALSKQVDGNKAKEIAKHGWDDPAVRHAVISLKAISEVMDNNPEYDDRIASAVRSYNTPKYLFDPFMRDKNGKQTNMLSPGAMIKIGVVISDIINYSTLMEFDADGDLVGRKITEVKDGLVSIPWRSIQESFFSLLLTIGMILACVFCAIQYCMTIFEFFILTSVGIVFVPCILWDGTKSFAAKLITLFLAYFFKLMLMIFCLFWVYGFFLDMGITLIKSTPILSFLNIGYFLFSVILGWVVTQNGPKLATTLLNGTPDLSMGEFLRAAGTAATGAYAAKRAYAGATNAVSSTGKTAHKGLQAGTRAVVGLDAMARGVGEAVNAEGDKQGWGKGTRFGKTVAGVAGLIGQNVVNRVATFATGIENRNSSKDGIAAYGKGNAETEGGARGEQNYKRTQFGAKQFMENDFNKKNENAENNRNNNNLNNSNPPPDTTPRFNGRRDTDADGNNPA